MTDDTNDGGGQDMTGHVHTELGAYVLGALEPDERRAVEDHVTHCAECRDELARLSGLPPLLDRLSVEEVTADVGSVSAQLAARGRRAAADEHVRLRRHLRWWQAGAAAAALLAVVAVGAAWQPWASPPDRLVAQLVPLSEDAGAVEGTIAAYAWEWGTTIELRVDQLPPRTAYLVYAVAEDGTRQRAGTWGPTADGGAMVRAASAIQRPALARVQVTDPDGTPLFEAAFDATAG